MNRYLKYVKDVWELQATRKVIGLEIFGVLLDNSTAFTPGDQLQMVEGAELAVQTLVRKGYNFLIISGQPALRTKNLQQQDFENIIGSVAEFIQQSGGHVKNVYFAPGTDKHDEFVKPNTGMFDRAQREKMITWKDAIYIGSTAADVKAAAKVKAVSVLINNGSVKLPVGSNAGEYSSLLEFAKSLDSNMQ